MPHPLPSSATNLSGRIPRMCALGNSELRLASTMISYRCRGPRLRNPRSQLRPATDHRCFRMPLLPMGLDHRYLSLMMLAAPRPDQEYIVRSSTHARHHFSPLKLLKQLMTSVVHLLLLVSLLSELVISIFVVCVTRSTKFLISSRSHLCLSLESPRHGWEALTVMLS